MFYGYIQGGVLKLSMLLKHLFCFITMIAFGILINY
jgi:hypothetical protein